MRRIALLVLVPLLLLVSQALAAGPQKGHYNCWFTGMGFTSEIVIAGTKYRIGTESGRFVVKGKRLVIKSGPYKNEWKSVTWSTVPDANGTPRSSIHFHPKRQGDSLLQCVRRDG